MTSNQILIFLFLFTLGACNSNISQQVNDNGSHLTIREGNLEFILEKSGFRYGFREAEGKAMVPAHAISGLLAGDPEKLVPASSTIYEGKKNGFHNFEVTLQDQQKIQVRLKLTESLAHFQLKNNAGQPIAMALRTGGASPGYGLGDNQLVWNRDRKTHEDIQYTTDITGFSEDKFYASGDLARLSSNFAIYPTHGFALINVDPGVKMVRSTEEEILQGSRNAAELPHFYYIFGTLKEIYKQFLTIRNTTGFPVLKPRYTYMGVGWEAWGALAWKTSEATVKADIDKYLAQGYPLKWMVVGSGFWPHTDDSYQATTSFGMWDKNLYPDPESFKNYFRSKGLAFNIGLRISFIQDGPFSQEGLENGYFLKENGKARVFNISFPNSPIYLLDVNNKEAVTWYANLCDRWGVDGFKEDLYGYGDYILPDDKINAVNEVLMKKGYDMMMRNSYLASLGDIHRINDFNYGENQDRGPVNSLSYAYSGFPLVYMDIIGGTFGGQEIDGDLSQRMKTYLMRNARAATLHTSVSMGKGPWNYKDPKVESVLLESAKLHNRLHPYLYSNAIKFYRDGYPHTMTPLPLAFPGDPNVHNRENDKQKGYQWMIGDALLACPIYGNDYETASSRDVYLPKGKWMDYDNGKEYTGPIFLRDFEIPVEKTPLFVGGTGILVEEVGGELKGRIYPITAEAESVFYGKDGESTIVFQIDHPDWKQPKIFNTTTKEEVLVNKRNHAFEFSIIPGQNYLIK